MSAKRPGSTGSHKPATPSQSVPGQASNNADVPRASLSIATTLVVAGALLAVVLVVQATRDPPFAKVDLNSETYDIVPVVAPRTAGLALQAMAVIFELPQIGTFLRTKLLKDNQLYRVRQYVHSIVHDFI